MRLNRFLAAAGFGSRRACEALITEGRVSINGHFIRELATTVGDDDDVRVGGRPARSTLPATLVLHKPRGYICTRSDERGRQTIFDLIPPHFGRLFHVGRLDKDSEGLMVLTNDGALAQKLTHPTHEVPKEYEVMLDKDFDGAHSPKLVKGFSIEGDGGEPVRAKVEAVFPLSPRVVKVVLRQGIKRQIRLMFYKLGYNVKRLMRVRIGVLSVPSLKPGAWRRLTAREIALLTGTPQSRPKPSRP